MLENLLLSGFDKKTSLELINSSLINQNEEIFATFDIQVNPLKTTEEELTAELEAAGVTNEGVSPLLLPNYARHER